MNEQNILLHRIFKAIAERPEATHMRTEMLCWILLSAIGLKQTKSVFEYFKTVTLFDEEKDG